MRIIILLSILLLTSCSTMRIKRMYNREIQNQNKEYVNNVNNLMNYDPSDTAYIRYELENIKTYHKYIIDDLEYRKSQVKYLTREEKKSILSDKVIKLAKLDADGDGVIDVFDLEPDTDGDGIIDSEDKCPKNFGIRENGGCPEIVMHNLIRIEQKFNLSLIKDFNDFVSKNPDLDEETINIMKNYFNERGILEYNRNILNEMYANGSIDKKSFHLYMDKLMASANGYIDVVIKSKSNYIPDVENMDIVDNTDGGNSSKGTIAYSVPSEMQVGKQYVIKLRITKERGKEINQTLVLGDRNIPISDIDIDSKIIIENIRVEKTMTAQLISSDDAFKVTPQNTEKQVIEDGEYTEWGWLVTPLKTGNSYLKLIIKIRIDSDGETTYKDIVVFDKNIKVKTNINYGVSNWLSNYWQWLMTTIIIPLIVFFYKNRKKKESDTDEVVPKKRIRKSPKN